MPQLQATSSYLPGSQKSVAWAPEMIMLFWETLQCNKRFRSFIVDTDRAHDFVILILFYALEYKTDAAKQGLVRMCVFVLQTLSTEENFGKRLNHEFEGQASLPANMRLEKFKGTYADFLIIVRNFSPVTIDLLIRTVYSCSYHNEQRKARRHLSSTPCDGQ